MTKDLEINGVWLTIANYKEPLKKIPTAMGFGYYGTLLMTPDGDQVLCAKCGKLFHDLGRHVASTHKEFKTVRDYREEYKLAYTTALVSESRRQQLKENMMTYLATLTPEQMKARRENAVAGLKMRSSFQPKGTLETMNKRGVCPDQILEKIMKTREKLGRTPTMKEFTTEAGSARYKRLIYAHFGTWDNALSMLGLIRKTPEQSGGRKPVYSKEYLLQSLFLYAKERGAMPTTSDCKRGIIPAWKSYQREFGSFENAKELAGVYEIITDPALHSNAHRYDVDLSCKWGHPLEENLVITKRGSRECRECRRLRAVKFNEKRKYDRSRI